MDAHEFYLYFGASYVLICQLELKLWNHNYKFFIKICLSWRVFSYVSITKNIPC